MLIHGCEQIFNNTLCACLKNAEQALQTSPFACSFDIFQDEQIGPKPKLSSASVLNTNWTTSWVRGEPVGKSAL